MSDISASIAAESTFSSPAGQQAPAGSVETAPTNPLLGEQTTPPAAPAAPAVPAPAAPAAPEDDSKFGEHAGYIKQLRQEAADRRVALKPYEDALGGFSEGDRGIWLSMSAEIAQALASQDPKVRAAAAEKLGQISAHLSGGEQTSQPAGGQEPQPEYLTREQVDSLMQEREVRGEIERKVADLGYQTGTLEHRNLLWIAANETNYDLDAAHAKIEENNQAVVTAYLEKKGQTPGSRQPKAPTTKGATPATNKAITNWKDSKAALNEFLDQRPAT